MAKSGSSSYLERSSFKRPRISKPLIGHGLKLSTDNARDDHSCLDGRSCSDVHLCSRVPDLPEEILLMIFEHLLILPGEVTQQRTVTTTLLSACYSCRPLYRIVSPLLWRNVALSKLQESELFIRSLLLHPNRRQQVMCLLVDVDGKDNDDWLRNPFNDHREFLNFMESCMSTLRSAQLGEPLTLWTSMALETRFVDDEKNQVREDFLDAHLILLALLCPSLRKFYPQIGASTVESWEEPDHNSLFASFLTSLVPQDMNSFLEDKALLPSLHDFRWIDKTALSAETRPLEHLQELTVIYNTFQPPSLGNLMEFKYLMPCLCLPSLTEFHGFNMGLRGFASPTTILSTKLEILTLPTSALTTAGFEYLVKCLPHLRVLEIELLPGRSGSALDFQACGQYLSEHCKSLQSFKLYDQAASVESFGGNSPIDSLTELHALTELALPLPVFVGSPTWINIAQGENGLVRYLPASLQRLDISYEGQYNRSYCRGFVEHMLFTIMADSCRYPELDQITYTTLSRFYEPWIKDMRGVGWILSDLDEMRDVGSLIYSWKRGDKMAGKEGYMPGMDAKVDEQYFIANLELVAF